MSKKWEDEFDKRLGRLQTGPHISVIAFKDTNIFIYVKVWVAKHLSRAVAKERTQLLARVREEVIGKKIPYSDTTDVNVMMALNIRIKEQLKKLEIISEEGKE